MKTYLVTWYNEEGYEVKQEEMVGTYSWVWNEALLANYNDFKIQVIK